MLQEKIIVGKGTKYPLNGLLTLPKEATTPVPAVVMIHGSGSSNMDEKVGKLTPFKDIAEQLAKHGIASIRYDKRSFAHGFKMLRDKSTIITVKEETIDDALLATELLRNDPRIDPDKIFIIGHSMGGMLAPRIDAEGGNYKGIIIMAGITRKIEELLIEQLDELVSSMNKLLKKLSHKKIQQIKATFDGLYELTDEEAKKKKFGGGTTLYYFKEMGSHPTSDYLLRLQKPVLIMQGEKDFQVKADTDFRLYQELLAGKTNVTFKLYDNLNHVFVPSVYGTIAKAKQEYNIKQHIDKAVIADIANWILSVSN